MVHSLRTVSDSLILLGKSSPPCEGRSDRLTFSRGFAVGWDYALNWLVILPFEITAAGITIQFWRSDINIGVWITVFLVVLSAIQIFGVRGYGEGENAPLGRLLMRC
jgi:hypothetical protein